MNRNEMENLIDKRISVVKELQKVESAKREIEHELTAKLMDLGQTDFFSVNWDKLHRAYNKTPMRYIS